jgi:hypothetical protein
MYDSGKTTTPWPQARGSREQFAATYGEALAERFGQAYLATDPEADALFTSGHTVREIMMNLRTELARGEADADSLPEVAALIDDMRAALDGVDKERIERGRRAYLSIPPLAHGLALGPGSLVHTYSTPAIADLLVNTGELTDGAVKRLAYTTNWIYSLFTPGGLEPGGKGFVHSGMVRTMHAHVRRVHNNRGLDYSAWGSPISQFDMLRTWLDFTYIPYQALRNMGWRPDQEQIRDIFYLWRVVGRVIGIHDDLMEGLDDIESSQETLDAIHTVDGEPNQASQDLVDALMSGFVVNAQELTKLPTDSLDDWTAAHVRIIHGDELADHYNVAHSVMRPVLEMNTEAVAERYDLLRADPVALQAEVEKNEGIILQLLTDATSYNKQDEGLTVKSAG